MHLKSAVAAALLFAAMPASAEPEAASPPAAEAEAAAGIQQAAQGFGLCLKHGFEQLAPEVAPETGAEIVVRGCSEEQALFERALEHMIAAAPAEQQADARKQARTQLDRVESHIADAIRQQRAAAAAAAPDEAPAPAPSE